MATCRIEDDADIHNAKPRKDGQRWMMNTERMMRTNNDKVRKIDSSIIF